MRYSVRQVRRNARTGVTACVRGDVLALVVLVVLVVSLGACAKRPEESVVQHSVASSSGDASRAQGVAGARPDGSRLATLDVASAARPATLQRCMVPTQEAAEVPAAAAQCPSDPEFGGPQLSVELCGLRMRLVRRR